MSEWDIPRSTALVRKSGKETTSQYPAFLPNGFVLTRINVIARKVAEERAKNQII